jgi:hypothetical protein
VETGYLGMIIQFLYVANAVPDYFL